MTGRRHLHHDGDQVFLQPDRTGRAHGAKREAAIAIDLPLLHGHAHRRAVRIAVEGPELRSDQRIQHARHDGGIGLRPVAAQFDLAGLGVLEAVGAGGAPAKAGGDIARHRADPVEFQRIEFRGVVAMQGIGDEVARGQADDRAIARGHIVEIIRHHEPAGAGHVLGDDGGLAGNMLANMALDHAHVDVIARARAITHEKADGLAPVEILHRLGGGGRAKRQNGGGGEGCPDDGVSHGDLPWPLCWRLIGKS